MGGACSDFGDRRGAYRVCWGNLRERDLLGDDGVDGRIILGLILKRWNVWYELYRHDS